MRDVRNLKIGKEEVKYASPKAYITYDKEVEYKNKLTAFRKKLKSYNEKYLYLGIFNSSLTQPQRIYLNSLIKEEPKHFNRYNKLINEYISLFSIKNQIIKEIDDYIFSTRIHQYAKTKIDVTLNTSIAHNSDTAKTVIKSGSEARVLRRVKIGNNQYLIVLLLNNKYEFAFYENEIEYIN